MHSGFRLTAQTPPLRLNHAHAARAQLGGNAVMGNCLPDQWESFLALLLMVWLCENQVNKMAATTP